MATGTLVFRPNADISVSHNRSTGNNGYSLINETTADDDSSYIYQTLSSTSSRSVTSTFTLGLVGTLPTGNIQITAARLYSRAKRGNNNESASYTCYFAAGTQSGGNSSSAATSATLTTSYVTTNSTSSSLVNDINNLILPNDFPYISVKVTTTGAKSSGKNASNGYARVTQIYAEFDYEEVVPEQPDIPVEDPTEVYHSITISSINANTNPSNGTIRVVEGSDQTISILPQDPLLSLALDNGVDITSQLVGGLPVNNYTVTTKVTGATYGFNLNSTTGYYVSSNNGVSKSASVARLNMNFESDCLVTIQYINYAEANYDYGMFGKLDTTVATDGLTAGSNGSSPSDSTSHYQLARCSNSSSAQTITYEVPMGKHYIDIKYGKDDASDSGNDSLQWKVLSIEATSAGGNYTYTLTNINEKHSLVFVFGEVTYYFINTVGNDACRLFPDGQQVKLPGDTYFLNIVPNNPSATVRLGDNGTEVTSQLTQETLTDKNGNPVTTYKYELYNIQATHELIVQVGEVVTTLFFKENNIWKQVTKAYKKINGNWVEQSITSVFDTNEQYRKL